MTRSIALVAFDDVQSLDVVGPLEVFSTASLLLAADGRAGYETGVATAGGRPARGSSGLEIGARWSLEELGPVDTLLIAGGLGARRAADDPQLVELVAGRAAAARRVGSVCTGAFLLAATGRLDGRRATTHWAWANELSDAHPGVTVDADAIYTCTDDVWTSAGVTAGMDLALALVADDHDDELARQVAQWLVIYLRRTGGQSQFTAPATAVPARRDEIRRAQDRIASDPSSDCSVAALAATASMSPRHFARLFADQVGTTPARYVESCRIDLARTLLETTDLTLAEVARRSGIGDASTLHRTFERRMGTTPAAYRSHFTVPTTGGTP